MNVKSTNPSPTSGFVLTPKYRVNLVVERKSHFYDVTTETETTRYPGVTGFLSVINKPALVPWAKKEALISVENALLKRLNGRNLNRVLLNKSWITDVLRDAKKRPDKLKEEAGDLGTQVHAFIDEIIHGREPMIVPDEIKAPVAAFYKWWTSSGIELIAGDTKVASPLYGYGGSLDALGRRNGKLIILDWKTSSGIYNEYALQVSAYAEAFFETYGIPIEEGIIVRFGKKLPIDFEKKELSDLTLSLKTFLDAKSLKENLSKPHFMPI